MLVSCGALKNMNQPLGDSGYDPLDGPGKTKAGSQPGSVKVTGPKYTPGQWIETAMPNSTFFRTLPKGNATADKVLPAGTPLKFIKTQSSFAKVELNSGDVGFVPAIMVAERRSPGEIPIVPGVPSYTGSVSDLPPLPESTGIPADGVSLPSGIAPPPVDGSVPPIVSPDSAAPQPVTPPPVNTTPLPDLPPPPEVPGITEPQPID